MVSTEYLRLCKAACERVPIVEAWAKLEPLQRCGCLIAWRSFLGIVVPCKKRDESGLSSVIPETLAIRTWCSLEEEIRVLKNYYIEHSTIHVDVGFGNEGFPVFQLRQLLAMFPLVAGEFIFTNIDLEACPETHDKFLKTIMMNLIAAAIGVERDREGS